MAPPRNGYGYRRARKQRITDGPVMPLHMRRAEFDPVDELADVRQNEGVRPVVTALGLPAYLVTRYDDDVRAVLSDSTRFSNAGRRFFGLPDGCQVSDEELARMRAGQLPAFDPPEHTRLRRMLTPALVYETRGSNWVNDHGHDRARLGI